MTWLEILICFIAGINALFGFVVRLLIMAVGDELDFGIDGFKAFYSFYRRWIEEYELTVVGKIFAFIIDTLLLPGSLISCLVYLIMGLGRLLFVKKD